MADQAFQDDMFHPDQTPRLAEDGPTPAAPADDVPASHPVDPTHPLTDTDVDQHEVYDEGISAVDGVDNT